MSFLGNIVSSAVKTALTPIAVVKDAVSIVTGDDADATKKLLNEAAEDASNAADDLFGE